MAIDNFSLKLTTEEITSYSLTVQCCTFRVASCDGGMCLGACWLACFMQQDTD